MCKDFCYYSPERVRSTVHRTTSNIHNYEHHDVNQWLYLVEGLRTCVADVWSQVKKGELEPGSGHLE